MSNRRVLEPRALHELASPGPYSRVRKALGTSLVVASLLVTGLGAYVRAQASVQSDSDPARAVRIDLNAQVFSQASAYGVRSRTEILEPQVQDGETDSADDASLSSLSLVQTDGAEVDLTPEFFSDTLGYSALMTHGTDSFTLLAATKHARARLEFLDTDNAPLSDLNLLQEGLQTGLALGPNTIKVRVTAANQVARMEYTIDIRHPFTTACERTPEVRDEIVGQVPGVDHCAEVTAEGLARIQEFLLVDQPGLERLVDGDFAGLSSLAALDISGNAITSLSPGVFSGMPSLRALVMTDNQLQSLPAGVFSTLPGLSGLRLIGNKLSSLPDGIFDSLMGLRDLNLSGNLLRALPASTFANLSKLRGLDLSTNQLTGLPDGIFENLTELSTLLLHDNPGSPGFLPSVSLGQDRWVDRGASVVLDGTSRSGGPWGSNFTFEWDTLGAQGVPLSGTDTLSASFTAPDRVVDLVYGLTITGKGLDVNGQAYAATAQVEVRVGQPPRITSVSFTSPQQSYAIDEEIEATVTFDAPVEVTSNSGQEPFVELDIGGRVRRATSRRSGTGSELVFVYGVEEGDEDADGVAIRSNTLTAPSGSEIRGAGRPAQLGHQGVVDDSSRKVDAVRPVLTSAKVDGTRLELTFSEPLDEQSSASALRGFEVLVGGIARQIASSSIIGDRVQLALETKVNHGEEVALAYAGASDGNIRDLVGNHAAGFGAWNHPVVNETKSTDATLSALDITDHSGVSVALIPSFRSGTLNYSGSVDYETSLVTVSPTTTNSSAIFRILKGANRRIEDADASADGFQASLDEGENLVRVKVTAGDGVNTLTYEVSVTRQSENTAPSFPVDAVERSFTESPGDAVNFLEEVGALVRASDSDGDHLTYSLGGADASSFDINSSNGQILTRSELNYDFEIRSSYSLSMEARDGRGGSDRISVTVRVNDRDEPPRRLYAPIVSSVPDSTTSLSVTWTAPSNAGRPDILGYDLRYRLARGGEWQEGPLDQVGSSVVIEGLQASTHYLVEVKAKNDEGESAWSDPRSGKTNTPPNNSPTFGSESYERSFPENQGDTRSFQLNAIGDPLAAMDSDGDSLRYSIKGDDSGSFYINPANGQIRNAILENYDHESKDTYSVVVKVEDGRGGSDRVEVIIHVTDLDEPPLAPEAPEVVTVSLAAGEAGTRSGSDGGGNLGGRNDPASEASLQVNWISPKNDGRPSIESYNIRYREDGVFAWMDGPQDETGRSASIPGLKKGTTYEVQVQARNEEGEGGWSNPGFGTTEAPPNTPPTFAAGSLERSFAEDAGDAGSSGVEVGDAVTATDADGDSLAYSFVGGDAALFEIGRTDGQIRTRLGRNYNHESTDAYSLTVRAEDGKGGSDSIEVTIRVTDLDEPPGRPGAPVVAPVAGLATSLSVTWTAPPNDGRPGIESYDLRYRESGSDWINGPRATTATSAALGDLIHDTLYEVQVRARNEEGEGGWSDSGVGATGSPPNTPPSFAADSLERSFAEDEGDAASPGVEVGEAVMATDLDGDSLAYSLVGGDAALFGIGRTHGQIRTRRGRNYDHESASAYSLTVRVQDGKGGVDSVAVTIGVTDLDEPPLAPAMPSVSPVDGSGTSLSLTWTAPPNDGRPGIESYDLRYRESGSDWINGPRATTATSAALGDLIHDTLYEVQVRARNEEGEGGWSDSGVGATGSPPNTPPSFAADSLERSFAEDEGDAASPGVEVGEAVMATDLDGDSLAYSLVGGDAALFGIGRTHGQIRTRRGRNYDHESASAYSLTVRVQDGKGGVDSVAVTIRVNDLDEPPGRPGAPVVAPVAGSATALSVHWAAPANAGRPDILGFDLRYRPATGGRWRDGPQAEAGSPAVIGGLRADTTYEVQVRARNEEGEGGWSESGLGTTGSAPNTPPTFDADSLERSFAEDAGDAGSPGVEVGEAVMATDLDGDSLAYSLVGGDAALFGIGRTHGQIRTRRGRNYDHESASAYSLTVRVQDGKGGVDSVAVTIGVNDLDEPPGRPGAPVVAPVAGSATSLSVTWATPVNAGRPDILGFDLRYRPATGGRWRDGPQAEARSPAVIGGLRADTTYEVQVRARNEEGEGGWSESGLGTTGSAPNTPPTFDADSLERSFAEDAGDAGSPGVEVGEAVMATDLDGDSLAYSLVGGDAALFGIGRTHGQIRTRRGRNYDHESASAYSLTVRVQDGKGGVDSVAVTIRVNDLDEPPGRPGAPVVAPVAGSATSLSVTWATPVNAGRPDILGFDLRYRPATGGRWRDGPQAEARSPAVIGGLRADTTYEVQVRARNEEGEGGWSESGLGTTGSAPNTPPTFDADSLERSFAEDAGDAGSPGVEVGEAVMATDLDGDSLAYSLVGGDAALFGIGRTHGQIRTRRGRNYDHESASAYSLTVRVQDGKGGVDSVAVTIRVNDLDEPPGRPGAPVVAPVAGSATSLSVTWATPVNAGRPDILGFDLRYRPATGGRWRDGPQDEARSPAVIGGLRADTTYEVQVRARNEEGEGGWSDSGVGTTGSPPNTPPSFAADSLERSFAEDEGDAASPGVEVGGEVTATDADGDSLTYSLVGGDAALFGIGSSDGQIRTRRGRNYDHESASAYSLTVRVQDGKGGVDSVAVTIRVNDLDEPPGRPGAPVVAPVAGSATSLSVTWATPVNAGRPDILGFDLRYRPATGGRWRDGPQAEARSPAVIGGLRADTTYEVQVRARNEEGEGGWSESGLGTTGSPPNTPPSFAADSLERSFAEDEGDAASPGVEVGGEVTATDADGDSLTYSLVGGDAALFGIGSSDGQIRTRRGRNYDHESASAYSLTVRVQDGNGGVDSVAVTIRVNDLDEPPGRPGAPVVAPVAGSATSLSVTWATPVNAGRPDILGFDLRYRPATGGRWRDGPQAEARSPAVIGGLRADTTYEVQVRARNEEGEGGWSDSGVGTTGSPPNTPPSFAADSLERSFAEDEGDAASPGVEVGGEVTATDADGDSLTYSLVGGDAAIFEIGSSDGQIRTRPGRNYDHESAGAYSLTVRVQDGNGGVDNVAVTIGVTDLDEPPLAPAMPSVSPVDGSGTSLSLTWTAPANDGRPEIESYDLRYRESGNGWIDGPQGEAGSFAVTEGLRAETAYEVQVRARNEEGEGEWSESGLGTTGSPPNTPPAFAADSLERAFAEDKGDASSSGVEIDEAVTATDLDGDSLTYSLVGGDAAIFEIGSSDGQIRTRPGRNYDHESTDAYSLTVWVEDGKGGSDGVEVTIRVDDRDEPPLAPAMPSVSPVDGSGTSLALTWTAPANDGRPGIESYDLRYREPGNGWIDGPQATTATNAALEDLTRDTLYEVQVRARSEEGEGSWSESGSARTPEESSSRPPLGELEVKDAGVEEGEGARLIFEVSLDQALSETVSVDYETVDGSALAGQDYASKRGTLTFEAGETSKIVDVEVLDDALAEGEESMSLVLSGPVGARFADDRATGSINDGDPMPRAWLARFGRSVADQAVQGVRQRISADRESGTHVTVAGQRLGLESAARAQSHHPVNGSAKWEVMHGQEPGSYRNFGQALQADMQPPVAHSDLVRAPLLAGTKFLYAAEREAGGLASFWGRGGVSKFTGVDGQLSLDGELSMATLGADYAKNDWIVGVSLTHNRGQGSFREDRLEGAVDVSLTGLFPYFGYQVSERLSLWSAAGVGSGSLNLTPRLEDGASIRTGLALAMVAAGASGELWPRRREADGVRLDITSDILWVRTESDSQQGPEGGQLAMATADVARVRVALESGWRKRFASGASIEPSLELGLLRDAGDAERGLGIEVAGGVAWDKPSLGLSVDLKFRGLITHLEQDHEEWGLFGSLGYDPNPSSDRGLSVLLSPFRGSTATRGIGTLSGVEAISHRALPGARRGDGGMDAELSYGFAVLGGGATGAPWVRYGLAQGDSDYRFGYRLSADTGAVGVEYGRIGLRREYSLKYDLGASDLEISALRLNFEAAHVEHSAGGKPDHRIGLGFSYSW